MRILYIAEIVGKSGVYALKQCLPALKQKLKPDFVIACADGATGGSGLGRNHAAYIRKLGVNVLTTGECSFYKKDLTENMAKIPYVLRPENFNAEAPGIGVRVYSSGDSRDNEAQAAQQSPGATGVKKKVAVAVFLGQSGFGRMHSASPFSSLLPLLERLRQETPYVIIDFHALATAEKQTLFALADGKCSVVIGSHTRVQTADDRILRGGTAVITDAGRTGCLQSVGGCERESRINEYLSGIPDWTRESWEKPALQGVFAELGKNGKALSIERVHVEAPAAPKKERTEQEAEGE